MGRRVGPGRRCGGQATLIALPLLVVIVLAVLMLFDSIQLLRARGETQRAADAAAYSVAQLSARQMNFTAYTNRAKIANEVSIGQFVALRSWMQRYARAGHDAASHPAMQVPLGPLGTPYSLLSPMFSALNGIFGSIAPKADRALASSSFLFRGFNQLITAFQVMFNAATVQSQMEISGVQDAIFGGSSRANLLKANAERVEYGSLGQALLPLSILARQVGYQGIADPTAQVFFASLINEQGGEFLRQRNGDFIDAEVGLDFGFEIEELGVTIVDISVGLSLDTSIGVKGGSELRMVGGANIDNNRYLDTEEEPEDLPNLDITSGLQDMAAALVGLPSRRRHTDFVWSSVDTADWLFGVEGRVQVYIFEIIDIDERLRFDSGATYAIDALSTTLRQTPRPERNTSQDPDADTTYMRGLASAPPGPQQWGSRQISDEGTESVYGGLWSTVNDVEKTRLEGLTQINSYPAARPVLPVSVQPHVNRPISGVVRPMMITEHFWNDEESLLPFLVFVQRRQSTNSPSESLKPADSLTGGSELFGLNDPTGTPTIYALSASKLRFSRPGVAERPNEYSPFWEGHLVEPDENINRSVQLAATLLASDPQNWLREIARAGNPSNIGTIVVDLIGDFFNVDPFVLF